MPVVPRAMMLAELMRFKQGIAVAGTHGKTTTTSLVAAVLGEAGLDPTCVIGGRLNSIGTNARLGKGEFLVAEADESDASFLYLQPVISVVTNIDADHMETYGQDFERLKGAFVEFLGHLPFYGLAVVCKDDEHARAIMKNVARPMVTYGIRTDADLRAEDVRWDAGRMRFRVVNGERRAPRGDAQPAGRAQRAQRARGHRRRARGGRPGCRDRQGAGGVRRASAGASSATARWRSPRAGDFALVDDYGHHPAEMAATIAAARGAFPGTPAPARVPAAPLHAHARPLRGLRARALERRRARARRRLPGAARRRSSPRTAARWCAPCASRARWSRSSSSRWRR